MAVLFDQLGTPDGLNLAVSPFLNKPTECREALGCDFGEIGILGRLPGYDTPYGSGLDASALLGLYDFKTTLGVTKWLAGTGTKIYQDSDAAGTWTAAHTGLTSGQDMSFATHLDNVIMVNGTDAPVKSATGTSFSTLGGSPPVAKYVITFNNSVYMLNLFGFTSRMRWSDDGTIDVWTSTNFQDITTNIGIGDQITGAAVNNNALWIFKNYSTWRWDTVELRCMNSNAGCRAPKSIDTIDNWTFWLGHKGIMATDGGVPFRISKKLQPIIDGIADPTTPVGWAEDNYYYLYVGTTNAVGEFKSIPNCLIRYDYDNNVVSYKSLPDAIVQAGILTTSANVRSAYIGTSGGKVHKYGSGLVDNTTNVPFKWVSAPYLSGYPNRQKDYHIFQVLLDRTAKHGIDVFYSLDFKDFQPLGQARNAVSEFKFPGGTKAHSIRIAYESNTQYDQQKILGHVCEGEVLEGQLGSIR